MVVLIVAGFSVSVTSPLRAQQYSPVVDDRVESGVNGDAPIVVDDAEHVGGLDIRAIASAAYDDNIFLSKTGAKSDTVYRLSPAVAYVHGSDKDGEGGFIRFAYRPTAVIYTKASSENRIDHQAEIVAGWRGKATQLTYTGGIQKLGDATADTGRQTDRLIFRNEIRAAWTPREKVTLEAAAGNDQSDYADPELFDSKKSYGEIAARYAYSPKTELGLAYQVGTFDVDGAGKQHTQQVTAQVAWQPREKIRLNLEAGVERRKTENGSDVNPVVDGRVEWTPAQGTSLYLAGYQREEASAFYSGQNYSVKGGAVGISQRLGDKWKVRLEGGRETASYSQVAGAATGGRKDSMWFVRPALEYKISDECDISLFYRATDSSSTSADFGYNQKMAGVELNYKF